MSVIRCYRKLKKKIYDNPFGNRYMTDVAFRTHLTLYLSLSINVVYVGLNVFWAIWYRTRWFGILSMYYAILAGMRFLLVRFVNENGIGRKRMLEFRCSRVCGYILMTLNLVLSGAVLMILYQDKGSVYHGVLIYAMATYAFTMLTQAIVNMVKYRKYKSPVMSTAKIISFMAALVSMLSLETAMLTEFGNDMAEKDKYIFIAATGAGVSIIVITMSIYMIAHATKEIKRFRGNGNEK